jgi:hypothetical protein
MRKSRRLKLALVAQSLQLFDSLASRGAAEDLDVVRIDPRAVSRSSRETQAMLSRFDAVILDERSRNAGGGIVRALRKANPDVPLISLGGRPGAPVRARFTHQL